MSPKRKDLDPGRGGSAIEQPMSPKDYAIIAASGMIISIGLLVLYISKATYLVENGIEGKVFYFTLVPLGLVSAAFIFGVMKSYAKYSGKELPGNLELGGPIVGAGLIVLGGFLLVPSPDTFSITARVVNANGEKLRSGSIEIYLGQDTRSAPISSNGDSDFKEIPIKFKNVKTVVNVIDGSGRNIGTFEKELSSTLSLTLQSNPENESVHDRTPLTYIRGVVEDRNGRAVSGATVRLNEITQSPEQELLGSTTESGGFYIDKIPGKPGDQVRVYAEAKGYRSYDLYVVLPGPVRITLDRIR